MFYALAADLLLVLHLGFICFVVAGGLLVCKWRWLVLLHLPAVVWAALLEFRGWICPLTYLENDLRSAAGNGVYDSGFIGHYLVPLVYPPGLTTETQILLGLLVLSINVIVYALVLRKVRARR